MLALCWPTTTVVRAFADMVQCLLQDIPAGIRFLLFSTTLQRGGTCAAHGIGAKLAQNRKKIWSGYGLGVVFKAFLK